MAKASSADEAAPPIQMVAQRYEAFVEFDRLTPHPANFNEGDIGLISELLEANGFGGAIMAQESTGIVIDGHYRIEAAKAKGMTGAPVLWMDVTDDERDRFLGSWNHSTRAGRDDESKLLAFLEGMVVTARGLAGVGHDGDTMDALTARLKPLVITDAPTGSQHAETPDEMAAREARIAAYQDRKQSGALVEMILVFSPEEHAEATAHLAAVRETDGDLPAAQIVLAALRCLVQHHSAEEAPAT